ncbi:hypothetical protein M0R04_09435 [Candidatus Dojkabacteria bacterium]|jgi:hypothetical protein|nr:hypothetical protein [Candidatus Dojkabacteria bacterium]
MELTDMKLPKISKDSITKNPVPSNYEDRDRWPYGLKLHFESDQVKSLPSLKDYKVGDRVMVMAEACVIDIRMSERQSGTEDHSIGMQIEKIAVSPVKKKKPEEMNMKEYAKSRGM